MSREIDELMIENERLKDDMFVCLRVIDDMAETMAMMAGDWRDLSEEEQRNRKMKIVDAYMFNKYDGKHYGSC